MSSFFSNSAGSPTAGPARCRFAALLALWGAAAAWGQAAWSPPPADWTPTEEGALRHELRQRLDERRLAERLPRLAVVPRLDDVAQAAAETVRRHAEDFPSRQPELLRDLAPAPGDALERLAGSSYLAATARGHLAISDRPPDGRLPTSTEPGGDPLLDDLSDARLRDVGIGVARLDGLTFYFFLLARSAADDFGERTAHLADLESVRDRLLAHLNALRAEAGRRALRRAPCLEQVAQRYAERMLREGFYDHQAPDGGDVRARVRGAGCRTVLVAENLAQGPWTAEQAVGGWFDSPAHRRTLLDGRFRTVGFGVAYRLEGEQANLLWVQILAR